MPGANLISLPLIPNDRGVGNIGRILGYSANSGVKTVTTAIWSYDATATTLPVEDRWTSYTPNITDDTDDLVKVETGKGYWWMTNSCPSTNNAAPCQFTMSAALPGLTQQTPKVEKLSYPGVFLRSGAEAPPAYELKEGWNLIGFHSEKAIAAAEYLVALGSGSSRKWSSLLRYDNFIDFPIASDDPPQFELGHFTRVFEGDDLNMTQGFWLYVVEDGVYTP